MDLKNLKDLFDPGDIEWRIGSSGDYNGRIWATGLAYVTNRAIMDRLDDVCGPDKWKNEFCAGPEGGVLCGISIKIDDEWITKWDGAENTNFEAVKGGLSGSMKRSAVQWGIGRYLYKLKTTYVKIDDSGDNKAKTKSGKMFKWHTPQLPSWAIPDVEPKSKPANTRTMKSLLFELDKLFNAKGLTDKVKFEIVDFYCEKCGLEDLDENGCADFISKFDIVLDQYHKMGG